MTDPAVPPPAASPPAVSPAKASRRDFRLIALLALLAAVGYACLTPFGGWIQSFFFGTGVRWENAYVALDAAEMNLPRDPRERERMLMANAMTEGEMPIGLKAGPRLHPVGTLAHLRYEIFDENGEPKDSWEVRALVPNIGQGKGPFWDGPCRKACRDELARGNGTFIQRSGEAGVPEEWVLRMPVGQTFNLKPAPLTMQDIRDKRTRRLGLTAMKVGDKSVPVPSKILVTLVKVCAANVRAGTAMNFEFDENAMIPVPRGFVVSRWVQLDGCGKLEPFDPPPADPPVHRTSVPSEIPDLHAVIANRDVKTGFATLKVDEAWLKKYDMPVVLHVNLVCRYDPALDKWQLLPRPDERKSWRLMAGTDADIALGNRVVFELPQDTALFWVHWSEFKEVELRVRSSVNRHALLLAGPILCNDIALGEAPPGKIAACVPFPNHAEARFVPEPVKACTQ